MRPPSPACTSRPECIQDFVIASYRVWDPPPVWAVADYRAQFGAFQTPRVNITQADVAYAIVVDSPTDPAIPKACGTWGTTQGATVTYLACGGGGGGGGSATADITLPKGHRLVALGVPDDAWRAPPGGPQQQKQQEQQQLPKAQEPLVGAMIGAHDPTKLWHFLGDR
jgi:hypothetical protein